MYSLSRREFMQGTALLAATAASEKLLPQADAQQQTTPPAPRGANERLNVAVIGVNGRGMSHITEFSGRNNCVVTHVCDADTGVVSRAVNAARGANPGNLQPQVVQDLRRIMENRDIHVVTIATPNHWHSLAAIWAMQAGKDVYVEKPVSHNVWEGRRLVEIARSTNKICQAGTQARSSNSIRQAFEWMNGGGLGELRVARGLCYKARGTIGQINGQQPELPRTVDYNLWCGPAPQRPSNRRRLHYDWHWQWDFGNGDLGNQGIHQMDIARWGLNRNELCRGVVSVGGRFGYTDDGETANTQLCFFDYGPQQLIFEVRGLNTARQRGVGVGNIFHCANGYLVVSDSYNGAVVAFGNDGREIRRFTGGSNHFTNFVQAVRSRRREDLKGDVLEGHLSSALCHLGNISYRLGSRQQFAAPMALGDNRDVLDTYTAMAEHVRGNNVNLANTQLTVGRRLTLNPQTERFVNDDEANRMLTREYRAGFVVPAA